MKIIFKLFGVALLVQLFSCGSDDAPPPPPPGPDPVQAEFSANATAVVAGELITFSDQSTGGANTWSWTFDGGNPATSTDKDPMVSYLMAGTYDVQLTVSNSNSNDTETKSGYIVVTAKPIPDEFDIIGTWERTESNNPVLDGMQVTVDLVETEGEIVKSPSASYLEGDIKWRNIEKISQHEYKFEDLFTNGNYGESSIFILAYGNELIIGNLNESNLGSFQRWVRVDFHYPEDEDYSLTDIWKRIRSNAPPLDGMRVEVDADETQGVIIETPDEALFQVGVIKWNDIQKEGANRFVFRDRGTNGDTTVESRMFIVGKEGPEVVIGSFTTALGSFQKWARE